MVYFIDLRKKQAKKSVRIRFLDTNKFGDVDKVPAYVRPRNYIIIETDKGEEIVKVIGNSVPDKANPSQYKFLRKANKKDIQLMRQYDKEAEKALYICKSLAKKLDIKMNLLKAYIPFSRSKILFYYVSEDRVDFRELVKELAKKLKMRIEMRQVGVRDGVQLVGAVGVCGNSCCCSNFIDKFETVNIEMIEEQNLPSIPSKFTGVCGRLMCCLSFEKENYFIREDLPPLQSEIKLDGDGKIYKVKNYDFIREYIELLDDEGNIKTLSFDTIKNTKIEIISLPEIQESKNCENCQCPSKNTQSYLYQEYNGSFSTEVENGNKKSS